MTTLHRGLDARWYGCGATFRQRNRSAVEPAAQRRRDGNEGRTPMSKATVITYHGLGDSPPARDPYRMFMPITHFEAHLTFLARRRTVVPLDAVVDGRIPSGRPVVAITFDDGYRSVLEEAVPRLRRHGFPATCFVPTKWIGERNAWDTFDDDASPLPIMGDDELLDIRRAGVRVESHGHAHCHMGEVAEEEAQADAVASMDLLTELLGERPRYLAYPYGSQSEAARRAVARAGFEAAFSIGQRSAGPFGRERVTIRPADPLRLYAFKTSGRFLAWRNSRVGDIAFSVVRPAVLKHRNRT
jgi:peptidoglycan/xylan/chitin deacetylase (PgdA/CDA1 family)